MYLNNKKIKLCLNCQGFYCWLYNTSQEQQLSEDNNFCPHCLSDIYINIYNDSINLLLDPSIIHKIFREYNQQLYFSCPHSKFTNNTLFIKNNTQFGIRNYTIVSINP